MYSQANQKLKQVYKQKRVAQNSLNHRFISLQWPKKMGLYWVCQKSGLKVKASSYSLETQIWFSAHSHLSLLIRGIERKLYECASAFRQDVKTLKSRFLCVDLRYSPCIFHHTYWLHWYLYLNFLASLLFNMLVIQLVATLYTRNKQKCQMLSVS